VGLAAMLLPRSGAKPVVIGAKTFTEQYILAALLEQRIAATGVPTEVRASLGSTVAFDALVAGDVDVYVDYTGTIWATVLKRTEKADRATVLREVTRELADRGVAVAASLGFENTYALAMPRKRAETMGIRAIGDLVPLAAAGSIGGDYEFFSRPEWRSIRDTYGLTFAHERSMDPSLMYEACASQEVDVISAFSTDGRIEAYDLAVLRDDRGAIPPYDAIVLVNAATARERPAVLSALARLDGAIDADQMRKMNAEVDAEGHQPADVARRFAR
jgi:osmoprotectant transport system permease protein